MSLENVVDVSNVSLDIVDISNVSLDIIDSSGVLFDESEFEEHKSDTIKSIIDEEEKMEEDEEEMSQDTKQKYNTALTLMLELYRVIMGCLLVIFIPQECDGEACSVSDNTENAMTEPLHITGFVFNLVTLSILVSMYYFETRREFKMISYLESNSFKPRDGDSVEKALLKLSDVRKNKILDFNEVYSKLGYLSIGCFSVNSVLSGVVVFNNFLDGKTITVYITNILFMGSKLYNVYEIINTDKNIFYSAFLTRKVQYNDVDPDKIEFTLEP